MSFPPDITRLYAIAATLSGGKSLRIAGNVLKIRTAMVHNMGPEGAAVLNLALTIREEDGDHPEKNDCDCSRCKTGRAINKRNADAVVHLITDGSCPSAKLILDSSFASEEGFHVKLRNTSTGTTSVGQGDTLAIAVAKATTAALTP